MNFDFLNRKIVLAVTGNPVLHSKSPLLFNTVFKASGINAFYHRLAADTAAEAVEFFKSAGLTGMNVTAPFKQDMLKLVDSIDEDARQIGGINTIVNEAGKLIGYNTDVYGVLDSFREAGVQIENQNCIVIGAGGAGMAATYSLKKAGANVTIVNRTVEKAYDVAAKFGCNAGGLNELPQLLQKTKVVVSTLSASIMPFDEKYLKASHIVFDAVYKASRLSEAAIRKGAKLIRGESWLLNQAIPAFRHFMGFLPDVELMRQALCNGKNGRIKDSLTFYGFNSNDYQIYDFSGRIQFTSDFRKLNETPDMVLFAQNRSLKKLTKKINAEINQTFGN